MKITFRGWKREVKKHVHVVLPVSLRKKTYTIGKEGDEITWNTSRSFHARINGLALSGDFLMEVEMDIPSLKGWLKKYAIEHPEDAAQFIGEMNNHILSSLAEKSKRDKKWIGSLLIKVAKLGGG